MKTFFTKTVLTIDIYTAIRARNEKNAIQMARSNAYDSHINADDWQFCNPIKHWWWSHGDLKFKTTIITKKKFEDCYDENSEKKDFSHIDYE
jgi:hypothetical protein